MAGCPHNATVGARHPPHCFCEDRVGFCLKRTCVFSGIQFTRQFIEFVVVETKKNVSSGSNVILLRQTYGQHSGISCMRKTSSASISIFSTNLLHVPKIEMYRRVRCRSVHEFSTFQENTAAQCRLPIFKRVWPQDSLDVGIVQPAFCL